MSDGGDSSGGGEGGGAESAGGGEFGGVDAGAGLGYDSGVDFGESIDSIEALEGLPDDIPQSLGNLAVLEAVTVDNDFEQADSPLASVEEVPDHLVAEINLIGEQVLAELAEVENSPIEQAVLVDDAVRDAATIVEDDIAEQEAIESAEPGYEPLFTTQDDDLWQASQPEPEVPSPLFTGIQEVQPDTDDEIEVEDPDQPQEELPLPGDPETFPEEADATYPTVSSSPEAQTALQKIGSKLLPEAENTQPNDVEPIITVLHQATTTRQESSQTSEIFNAVLAQRGLTLENTSSMETHGVQEGELYTDKTVIAQTATGLSLIQNSRSYERSDAVTSELVATYSPEQYLQSREIKRKKPRETLEVGWGSEHLQYSMKWQNPDGPQHFPEDVDISMRREFSGPWTAEAFSNNPMLVSNGKVLRDDKKIMRSVHSGLDAARPKDLQPKVKRKNISDEYRLY